MISDERLEEIKKESTEFVDRLKDRVHEQEFEIERLNNDIKILLKENENKEKVILKYDNIINELEKILNARIYNAETKEEIIYSIEDKSILDILQKLKGVDKE